ncbi:MAG: hypothetical protein JWR21_2834 [Herminiimonas sp.]|jgi:hypothetical protein|nr:hypothetical protein [Herminiimonas sp.]
MATILRIVSAIYLIFIWVVFFGTMNVPTPMASVPDTTVKLMVFSICVGLSIPAVALFAFGQVVADVRVMRNNARLQTEHLDAMRTYYEPERRRLVG